MRMTTTLAAQRLTDALAKAKRIGAVEEGLTLMGLPIVLQTLRPQDYEDILGGIEGLDDVPYYNAYQLEHVARALIEIDGHDLRDVEYIEDEAPAGFLVWATLPTEELAQKLLKSVEEAGGDAGISPSDDRRQVKYERHEWIKKHVLGTWGREALVVAWHKFAELLVTADEQAKEGIEFRILDETAETKMRRVVGELRESFEGLPVELVDKVLKDAGLQRSSTVDEMRKATDRIDQLATEETAEAAPPPAAPPSPEPAPPEQQYRRVPEPDPAAPAPASGLPPAPAPVLTPEELMRARQPLNQRAINPRPSPNW